MTNQERDECDEMKDVLIRNGFVRCDIAACNCRSWHARYGLPERMQELKDALADAGHPLCNDNSHLIHKALAQLIAERDALAAERAEWVRDVRAMRRYQRFPGMHTIQGKINAEATVDARLASASREQKS